MPTFYASSLLRRAFCCFIPLIFIKYDSFVFLFIPIHSAINRHHEKKTTLCVFLLVLMTYAIDELPQTGVVAEQTILSATNTLIGDQLTENRLIGSHEQWGPQDSGPLESGKTEEKVVTLVKKVKVE